MLPRYHGFSDSGRGGGGGAFLVIPPNNIFRLPDIYNFEGEAEYDEQHFPRCGGAKLAANKWHSCAFQPSGW